MFGPRHDILVLTQLPRERGQLQTLINDARRRRRMGRLMRWAALNMVAWALYVLLTRGPLRPAAHPVPQAHHVVYLAWIGRHP